MQVFPRFKVYTRFGIWAFRVRELLEFGRDLYKMCGCRVYKAYQDGSIRLPETLNTQP